MPQHFTLHIIIPDDVALQHTQNAITAIAYHAFGAAYIFQKDTKQYISLLYSRALPPTDAIPTAWSVQELSPSFNNVFLRSSFARDTQILAPVAALTQKACLAPSLVGTGYNLDSGAHYQSPYAPYGIPDSPTAFNHLTPASNSCNATSFSFGQRVGMIGNTTLEHTMFEQDIKSQRQMIGTSDAAQYPPLPGVQPAITLRSLDGDLNAVQASPRNPDPSTSNDTLPKTAASRRGRHKVSKPPQRIKRASHRNPHPTKIQIAPLPRSYEKQN